MFSSNNTLHTIIQFEAVLLLVFFTTYIVGSMFYFNIELFWGVCACSCEFRHVSMAVCVADVHTFLCVCARKEESERK